MRQSKGFTLIELLVVIAIIALLMAILMPALSKAKNQAQEMACKGNLKNYCLAITMYVDDSDGKFPVPEYCYFSQFEAYPVESGVSDYIHLRWCNDDVNLKSHPEYAGPFFPYLANAKALACPAFRALAVRNSDDQFFRATGATVKHYKPWYNYTMNAYLGSLNSGVQKTGVKKISQVKKPWKTFCFVEESPLVDTAYNASGLNDTFMIPGDDSMVSGWMSRVGNNPDRIAPGPEGVGQFYDVVSGFHNASAANLFSGKGNCAILDGHVEAFTRAETFPHAYPR
ncbi:MAG: type II secretion system protein [Sedimentisphaerales bacterium]|nr:type II secretion system protein [Sedimentisphaerales bacterium]